MPQVANTSIMIAFKGTQKSSRAIFRLSLCFPIAYTYLLVYRITLHSHLLKSSLSDDAVIKALSIIHKNCIENVVYLDTCKHYNIDNIVHDNIVPVHKKGDKQIVNNYRPISLLSVLGKVIKKILLNSIFEYLEEKTPLKH